jgi:hypothetical protein
MLVLNIEVVDCAERGVAIAVRPQIAQQSNGLGASALEVSSADHVI